MSRSVSRRFLVTLLLACAGSLLSGCGEIVKTGLKGALQRVGAKVVNSSSDEHLRDMFEKANAACPTRMDIFTTLEEVRMIDDKHVEFRYLVTDAGKKIASHYDKRAMKKAVVEHMRGNAMAVAIAERDLSIEHIYQDSSGNHVLSYTINRAVLDGDPDPAGAQQANPFDVAPVKANAADSAVDQDAKPTFDRQPERRQVGKPRRTTNNNPVGIQTNPFFHGT